MKQLVVVGSRGMHKVIRSICKKMMVAVFSCLILSDRGCR
ncbi:hypothetical protein LINGRAHAP2_LOCUS8242 [Linum grandiflorum]